MQKPNPVVEAVKNRLVVSFMYDDFHREVEPHAVGVNKRGEVVLRAYQVGGSSSDGSLGWKLFKMARVPALTVEGTFDRPREGYKPGDRGMTSILAELSLEAA